MKDLDFFDALQQYYDAFNKKKSISDALNQISLETRSNLLRSKITSMGQIFLPFSMLLPEKRAVLAEPFAAEEVVGFEASLKAKTVLTGLGARMLTGLTNDLMIPIASGSSSKWEGEINEAEEGTPTIASVRPKPKRISTVLLVSSTVMLQTRIDQSIKLAMREDLLQDIMSKVELAAVNGSGSGEPRGILNTPGILSVAGGDNGAIPNDGHLIDLEKAVADEHADKGSLAYLTNPDVRRKLKKMPLDAGAGDKVWNLNTNDKLMGYPAGVTANVPNDLTKGEGSSLSAIIFGDFSKLWLCQWGGFDIIINPYSKSHENITEFVINSYWDVAVTQPKAFAAMQDAITAD